MHLGRKIVAWIVRHLIALVLILAILIAGRYALPPAIDWLRGQVESARSVRDERSTLAEARRRFDAWARERRAEADVRTGRLSQSPDAALRTRRAEIDPAIVRLRSERLGTGRLALAAATGDSDRIFAHYRSGAEIALLHRERRLIDALLSARALRGRESDLRARRAEAVRQLRSSYAQWRSASERAAALSRRPLAGPRNFLCRTTRPAVGCDNYRALVAARAERDSALARNREAQRTIAAVDRAAVALRTMDRASADAEEAFAAQREAMAGRLAELQRAGGENWLLWIRGPVTEMLPTALLILLGLVLGPAAIKAILYFAVAPVAARRPPIRLVASDRGEAALAGGPSAAAQRVALGPDRELLVLPEAVQSSPHSGEKRTQWLLDWRMPLSSIASGMVALIRMRSESEAFVLVAATGDPLAEVALVEIAGGSAMVLRPRALRGIVRPLGRPVRITRHWRLGRLSAWLTLQFRYLVFHGPCILIVEGTRGVRLEPAGPGRGINQAATIGFSAGLLYSVRRGEAFGAYLIGKQELFNDSFESGGGCYLYEQMPRARAGGGPWGRGVRGLGDAFLKVFGL